MKISVYCLSAFVVASLSALALAAPGGTQKLLDFYANQAKATDPGFAVTVKPPETGATGEVTTNERAAAVEPVKLLSPE